MKSKHLINIFPFLFTFLLVLFISLLNQKQNTSLKILIWDTPRLSLATYLSISTTSGFILSFFITNNIAKMNQPTLKRVVKYSVETQFDNLNEKTENTDNVPYENTLIERDIRDPSPTINANFRIISNEEFNIKRKDKYKNNQYYDKSSANNNEHDDIEERFNNETGIDNLSSNNDWEDNSNNSW
tara:strand:+ start:1191 stop:1745 length:555 start_codon:yes stop_codon:yes gene_type:complete